MPKRPRRVFWSSHNMTYSKCSLNLSPNLLVFFSVSNKYRWRSWALLWGRRVLSLSRFCDKPGGLENVKLLTKHWVWVQRPDLEVSVLSLPALMALSSSFFSLGLTVLCTKCSICQSPLEGCCRIGWEQMKVLCILQRASPNRAFVWPQAQWLGWV